MTKSEMDLMDSGILGPLFLFLNQYFNCLVNETLVLWICFVSTEDLHIFDVLRKSNSLLVIFKIINEISDQY